MRGNVVGMNSGDDLRQWYKDIPFVTKFFCTGTLLLGFLVTFNLVPVQNLVFVSELIRMKFQIWRLITPFLFSGKFSFNFAMHLMVMYENFKRYESFPFNTGAGGNTADFLCMIFVCCAILLTIAHYFNYYVLSEPLLFCIMYVWSRRDPEALLNLFGFRLKALYLPWVYTAIRLVMGNDIIQPLIGIGVGHVYYFIIEVIPSKYNYVIIKTPQICIDIANYFNGTNIGGPIPVAPAVGEVRGGGGRGGAAAGVGGYQWGRGNVLGRG